MSDHLPVLQVVIPLVAAPVCLLLRNSAAVRIFSTAAVWAAFAVAIQLLAQVLDAGVISYPLGGWLAPLGIEYRVDITNAFVLLIVSGIASAVVAVGPGPRGHAIGEDREYLYYIAYLLCTAGLLGVAITGDVFNIFVFLEISSLASYVLVALGKSRRALRAAFSYLVMGTIGGTFILIGIGFLYLMTGTLNLADLATRLPAVLDNRAVHVGFAFLGIGVSIKLAVFPLHQWLPSAYSYAPSAASAFLSATGTKVAYYLLLRFVFTLFGTAFVFERLGFASILLPLSLLGMFIGAIAAINQTDLKRLLAYSSVSQVGYMTLGLSTASLAGLTGGIVHLFNHALMKGGLFLIVACMVARVGSSKIEDLRGLGRRMPLTAFGFVLGGLGLIGVPLTAGFVSKWYLALGALEVGGPLLVFALLVSSLLAVAYVWKVVEVMYFQEPPPGAESGEAPPGLMLSAWVLIGGSLVFGVYTDVSVGIARQAAAQLLGLAL